MRGLFKEFKVLSTGVLLFAVGTILQAPLFVLKPVAAGDTLSARSFLCACITILIKILN